MWGGGYIIEEFSNLFEEELKEVVEIDNVAYHVPDKTNILLNKVEGKTNKIVQLLDYEHYEPTITNQGVIFSNYRNGWININGTSTAPDYSEYVVSKQGYRYPLTIKKDHTYLIDVFGDNSSSDLYVVLGSINDVGIYYREIFENKIITANGDANETYFIYRVNKGKTVINEFVCPRIYDLTELYGKGNEPTTYE